MELGWQWLEAIAILTLLFRLDHKLIQTVGPVSATNDGSRRYCHYKFSQLVRLKRLLELFTLTGTFVCGNNFSKSFNQSTTYYEYDGDTLT